MNKGHVDTIVQSSDDGEGGLIIKARHSHWNQRDKYPFLVDLQWLSQSVVCPWVFNDPKMSQVFFQLTSRHSLGRV